MHSLNAQLLGPRTPTARVAYEPKLTEEVATNGPISRYKFALCYWALAKDRRARFTCGQ
jgi:hypothetical protein